MIKQAKPCIVLCLLLTLQMVPAIPAQAFFFLKKKKVLHTTRSHFSETSSYQIYYHFDSSVLKKDVIRGQEADWIELNYKVVSLNEENTNPFTSAGGGKVRFYDKEGFIVASDLFDVQDFIKNDLYGSFWVENNRMKAVVRADAVTLTPDELVVLQMEKITAVSSAEPSPTPSPSAVEIEMIPSPTPSPTLSPSSSEPELKEPISLNSPSPEASPILASVTTNEVSLPQISPSPLSLEPAPLEDVSRQGFTNEDVEKTLAAFSKQLPTEMSEPAPDSEKEEKAETKEEE